MHCLAMASEKVVVHHRRVRPSPDEADRPLYFDPLGVGEAQIPQGGVKQAPISSSRLTTSLSPILRSLVVARSLTDQKESPQGRHAPRDPAFRFPSAEN